MDEQSDADLRGRIGLGIVQAGLDVALVRAVRPWIGKVRFNRVMPPVGERVPDAGITAGCMPVAESLTLWLTVPLASRAKVLKVLPSMLDIQLPFPLESCVYRFVDFQKASAGSSRVLAVAARRENITARLEAYRRCGVDPMLLDHEGLALWMQSLDEVTVLPGTLRVLVYLAQDHTVVVVGEGDQYRNAYGIQLAMTDPSGAGSGGAMTGTPLLDRVRRVLRADVPAGSCVQWVFAGAGAKAPALHEQLTAPLLAEWAGSSMIVKEPELFLARALAARAVTVGGARWVCNFRVGDLVHPRVSRITRLRSLRAAALLLAAAGLLCAVNIGWRMAAANRLGSIKRSVATVTAELMGGRPVPYGQETNTVMKALSQQTAVLTPFVRAVGPSAAGRLTDVVRISSDVHMTLAAVTLRTNNVVMKGVAEDWDRCELFAARVKQLGYRVVLERQEVTADMKVPFTVTCEGGLP